MESLKSEIHQLVEATSDEQLLAELLYLLRTEIRAIDTNSHSGFTPAQADELAAKLLIAEKEIEAGKTFTSEEVHGHIRNKLNTIS